MADIVAPRGGPLPTPTTGRYPPPQAPAGPAQRQGGDGSGETSVASGVPVGFVLSAPGLPHFVLGYGIGLPDGTAVTVDAARPAALVRWASAQLAADGYGADLLWADRAPAPAVAPPAPAAPGRRAGPPANRRPDHDRVWLTGPYSGRSIPG